MTILFNGKFSDVNFSTYNRIDYDEGEAYLPPTANGVPGVYELVVDPTYTRVAKLTANWGSPGRTEIRPNQTDLNYPGPVLGELWIATWIKIPKQTLDYSNAGSSANGNLGSSRNIIAQMHGGSDVGDTPHFPQFAIYLENDYIGAFTTYDTNATTTEQAPNLKILKKWPIEVDVWTEWVLHANWAYDGTGFLNLYKDRRKVYATTGPNIYNNSSGGIFFKSGIYKYGRTTGSVPPPSIVYNAGIVIGDSSSSYLEVTGHSSYDTAAGPGGY